MDYQAKMETSRTQVMRALARRMKMNFMAKDDFGLFELLRDFDLFRSGRRKKISNLLRTYDEWMDVDIRIFDYTYTRGKSKQRKYHRQTVFFANSKKLGIPELIIKPETFLHKIGEYLGMQDIDFEAFPKFSSQYLLKGQDEELIREVMSPDLLAFFSSEKGWSVEGVNYFLIFYKKNKLIDSGELQRFFNKGMRIHDLFVASGYGKRPEEISGKNK